MAVGGRGQETSLAETKMKDSGQEIRRAMKSKDGSAVLLCSCLIVFRIPILEMSPSSQRCNLRTTLVSDPENNLVPAFRISSRRQDLPIRREKEDMAAESVSSRIRSMMLHVNTCSITSEVF